MSFSHRPPDAMSVRFPLSNFHRKVGEYMLSLWLVFVLNKDPNNSLSIDFKVNRMDCLWDKKRWREEGGEAKEKENRAKQVLSINSIKYTQVALDLV